MKLGLLTRRERWALTLRGKLLILGFLSVIPILVRWQAYPFLAVNRPLDTETLIVEGWIPNEALDQAAAEFKRGHYRSLIVVRPKFAADAQDKFQVDDRDDVSRLLLGYGVPPESLGTLLYSGVNKDRTYHSALAARRWFGQSSQSPKSFNVVSMGPHARRSWLLYQKAFEGRALIGIVALKDPMYDPGHWWRTSEGVRDVLGEGLAYLYARLFFFWA